MRKSRYVFLVISYRSEIPKSHFPVVSVSVYIDLARHLTTNRYLSATIGYVVTWIMAQRILIHLRGMGTCLRYPFRFLIAFDGPIDAAARIHSQTISVRTITTTHSLTSPREISRAMRSHFASTKDHDPLDDGFSSSGSSHAHHSEEKSDADGSRQGDSTHSIGTTSSRDYGDVDLDIRVHVQRSVTVDYNPDPYQRENYRAPDGFKTAPR